MRRGACLAACALILSLPALAQAGTSGPSGRDAPAKARTARLESGPEAVRGLPFFPPNAIVALAGRYSVGADAARVYSCRAEVFLGPEWSPLPPADASGLGAGLRCFVRGRDSAPVLAIRAERYTLFVGLPRYAPEFLRFSFALAGKFSPFFSNAATDAELSFPAFIDF